MRRKRLMVAAAALLAVPTIAITASVASAATYTQNAFNAPATVNSGASFNLVANIASNPTVTPNNVGFCTRDANNGYATVAFVTRPSIKVPNTGVTIRQNSISLPDGTYVSAPCLRLGTSGSYTEVGSRKTIVVGSPVTPSPSPTPTVTPTPTPTPSPTPTATPSGYPDATNTGVPVGTTLTNYTGPSTITTANTVIDSKKITICIDIKANNVTIKNSLIQSSCFFSVLNDSGNTGLVVSDTEIDGKNNLSSDSTIAGNNYTCLRCNIHGTSDGFKAGTNVVIQDTYIHDLAVGNDSHNDGVQSLGTTSLKIVHNTIVPSGAATSAIILSTNSADQIRNVLINNNLLAGGAFTVYGGYQSGTDNVNKVSNISITNNKFSTRYYPRSGAFGPLTSTDSPVVVSGNTWYDGPNVGQPVN